MCPACLVRDLELDATAVRFYSYKTCKKLVYAKTHPEHVANVIELLDGLANDPEKHMRLGGGSLNLLFVRVCAG